MAACTREACAPGKSVKTKKKNLLAFCDYPSSRLSSELHGAGQGNPPWTDTG